MTRIITRTRSTYASKVLGVAPIITDEQLRRKFGIPTVSDTLVYRRLSRLRALLISDLLGPLRAVSFD
eukprot:9291764-Alexandrium_andersonii.AAC.1